MCDKSLVVVLRAAGSHTHPGQSAPGERAWELAAVSRLEVDTVDIG